MAPVDQKLDKPGESVLDRWSRLKRAHGTSASRSELGPIEPVQARPTRPFTTPEIAGAGTTAETLSDIASIMREEVPAALRIVALRKFWTEEKQLFAPDGLDVYCEDFTRYRNEPASQIATALAQTSEKLRGEESAGADQHSSEPSPAGDEQEQSVPSMPRT